MSLQALYCMEKDMHKKHPHVNWLFHKWLRFIARIIIKKQIVFSDKLLVMAVPCRGIV